MRKNFRIIPPAVRTRLKRIDSRYIVAGYSKRFSPDEIAAGALANLGITLENGELKHPPSVVPPASSGKFSQRNRNGYEVVRKDLPKETVYREVETPNWGDSYNGTHTVRCRPKSTPVIGMLRN